MDFDTLQDVYPGSAKKIVRHPNRAAGQAPKPMPKKRNLLEGLKPRNYTINGVETEFFTVGDLGRALGGRKSVTMRKWEIEGILPPTTFRAPSLDDRAKHRLYTREQVEGIILIAEEEGVLTAYKNRIKDTNFSARVHALFERLEDARTRGNNGMREAA